MYIKNMNETQKASLIAWCKSHDWGTGAYIAGSYVYGLVERTSTDGNLCEVEVAFDDMLQLKDWSGY